MRLSFLTFSILFGLVACTPKYKSEMVSMSGPISLDVSLEEALSRRDFEVGEWPRAEWWELFDDPQLNGLMEIALRDSPTLKKAQARVEKAKELAKKERARLFPSLNLEYIENWQYFSKNGFVESFYPVAPGVVVPITVNQLDLTLNFEYEFDFWGKNRHLFQAALGQARALEAEAAQATLVVLTSIAEVYFQLQASLAQREVLQERLEERKTLFFLTSLKKESGIDAEMPVLVSEQNLYAIEQALIVLEQEILVGQHLLKVLTGQGPDGPDLQLPLSAALNQPFPLPQNLTAHLLARRPDLQARIWSVESAAKEIGAAKADFYPNISLAAFGGWESLAFCNLFKGGSKTGALQPALTLPIFTGGSLKANLRGKVAAFNEAVYSYNALILQAAQEVADQLVILQAKKDELAIQESIYAVISDQYHLKTALFEKGISNYLDTLDMQEQLFLQQFTLLGVQRESRIAALKLIKALGGGYETPYTPTQEEPAHE